jgi:hypothetical protein
LTTIFAVVCEWSLPKTRKPNKYFVHFCSYYGPFIHHVSGCVAALTNLCHKNLPRNVVHAEVTKVAFKFLRARILSALDLLISGSGYEAECLVAIDANNVGIVGVRLQQDASRSLRSRIYWARILHVCDTNFYSYFDCEMYRS